MNEELDQEGNFAPDTAVHLSHLLDPNATPLSQVIVNDIYAQVDDLTERLEVASKTLAKDFPLGKLVVADWLGDANKLLQRIARAQQIVFK